MGLIDEFVPDTTALILLVVFVVGVAYVAVADPAGEEFDTEEVERLVTEETNEERVERGLQPVEPNGSLREGARGHSGSMARHGFVGHEGPDGEQSYQRYEDCTDSGGYFGENVANTWHDRNIVYEEAETSVLHLSSEEEVAEHLMRKWMDSAPHRKTLLNEDWAKIGVGVSVGDNNEVFAAQAFCSDPIEPP